MDWQEAERKRKIAASQAWGGRTAGNGQAVTTGAPTSAPALAAPAAAPEPLEAVVDAVAVVETAGVVSTAAAPEPLDAVVNAVASGSGRDSWG